MDGIRGTMESDEKGEKRKGKRKKKKDQEEPCKENTIRSTVRTR